MTFSLAFSGALLAGQASVRNRATRNLGECYLAGNPSQGIDGSWVPTPAHGKDEERGWREAVLPWASYQASLLLRSLAVKTR